MVGLVDRIRRSSTAMVAVVALIGSTAFGAVSASSADGTEARVVNVIITAVEGGFEAVATAVERAGGTITQSLGLIGGLAAEVPAAALDDLQAMAAVGSIVEDRSVELMSWADESSDPLLPGSMEVLAGIVTRASQYWSAGITGQGVDVAIIDSGIVPVEGLSTPGKLVNGPDLSFESQADELRYLDTFGHGTHLAGIIAGRDEGAPAQLAQVSCCYLLTDQGAATSLSTIDPFVLDPKASQELIGSNSTHLNGLAMQPGTRELFATTGAQLGVVDTTDGSFNPLTAQFGQAAGPDGSITIDNVVAMAFDQGGALFGVHRTKRGTDDLLVRIDPSTGSLISGAFPGGDYAVIPRPSATLTEIADIAFDPTSGQMYVVLWDGNGRYLLGTMDPVTGAAAKLGKDFKRHVDGVAFDAYGELWGIDADKAELVLIDKINGGEPSSPRPVTPGAYLDIAPLTADPFTASPYFVGMAPDARLVNVKVGDAEGAVDVSQVIAAIDWVVQHRTDNGLNIRVLNLSFGTDGLQKYTDDPLSFAVEQAWKAGIVVVVSAGNDGNGVTVRNPGLNPFVIVAGSANPAGTYSVADDTLSDFSNCSGARSVDVLAPGKSVVSLRNPGSNADLTSPNARVGDRLFKGTGTSQAAAMVSGAAALIIDQRPSITPDQVKELLMETARPLGGVSSDCQGAGLIDLGAAYGTPTPSASQSHKPSKSGGTLDKARGSFKLEHDGVTLDGEKDVFGKPFNAKEWALASAAGVSWSGGDWNGVSWSGVSWSGLSWSGVSWSGVSWSGVSWSGLSWSNNVWNGVSWSGLSWSGVSWSGLSWSGSVWSGVSWD